MKRPGQPTRTPFRRTRELARGSGPRTSRSSSAPLRSSALPADVAPRFWKHVQIGAESECWPWLGAIADNGYGRFKRGGDRGVAQAHRVAWALANEQDVPDGLHVLHSCDNRPCCNPAHLRAGSQRENVREAYDKGRMRTPASRFGTDHRLGRRTHCKAGHELSGENLVLRPGVSGRLCRTCVNEHSRRRYHRDRLKVNRARKASEFVRAYGSKARVAWVKRRPCIVAVGVCAGPIENAHVVKGDGGTSYKASAEFIAPMCHRHHRRLHSLGPISFQSVFKVDLAACAAETERAWRAHVGAAAA
jgi:hypothetical protein